MKSSFSAFLIEEAITTVILNEDLVAVLSRLKDTLSVGKPAQSTIESGLDVIALLRVYQYLLDKETGTIVGVNRLVGSTVPDSVAVNALKSQLRNNGVVASERKMVASMFKSGEKDGFSELKQQIDHLLAFLSKVSR